MFYYDTANIIIFMLKHFFMQTHLAIYLDWLMSGLVETLNTCLIVMRLNILCENTFYANTVSYLPRLIAQTGLSWTRFKPLNTCFVTMQLIIC